MKKIALTFICCAAVLIFFGQKSTYDLVSYIPPENWTKDLSETMVSYTVSNKQTGSWCRVMIIKSTASKGSIGLDFESEWQELIVKNYKPHGTRKSDEDQEADGWKIRSASTKFKFNQNDAAAMLTTATGFKRCASIVIVTNTQDYLKDVEKMIASVSLLNPGPAAGETNPIIGTWVMSTSFNQPSKDLVAKAVGYGYNTKQYTFNNNGTYSFISKTFLSSTKEMLLVQEVGTFQISGNNITVNPQKNIVEEWSKKDSVDSRGRPAGVDKWGKLLSTKKGALEKTNYQFTKHYFSGIQLWNLVLQCGKTTQRDGPFSNNRTFSNAYYYAPPSANNTPVDLPGKPLIAQEEINEKAVENPAPNAKSPILGTWGVNTTTASLYNTEINEGSMMTQYTFNANGSYSFYIKTFRYLSDKILLTRETGVYKITGNQLTITPQRSAVESWSRKDGTDNWGKLLSTDKKELEKVTYSFSAENFGSGMVLILKAPASTKRDGFFNNSNRDSWYYPAKSGLDLIRLPD